MTSTDTRSTPTPSTAADFAFPHAAVLDNFRNMLDAGSGLFRGWTAINSEIVDFASQQIRQNVEIWAHPRTLDDTLKAQADAAQAAIAQYFDAAGKLMTISTQAITESCATLQKSQSTNGAAKAASKAA